MAAVVDALVPLVVKMLEEMATREVRFLLGVFGDVKKLEKNMKLLKNILTDAERKRITDETTQEWMRKLKDAMYDATDTLDLCHLKAEKWHESGGGTVEEKVLGCCQPFVGCMQRPGCDLVMCGSSEKLLGFFRSLFFFLRSPVFTHDIGTRIKNINEQLDAVCEEARMFSPINLVSYPARQQATTDDNRGYIHTTTSEIKKMDVIGEKIKRDTNMLVNKLVTDNNNNDWPSSSSSVSCIMVVSIVGDGGIGKSTLAQCIFNNNDIKEHFMTRIWLSVTKNNNKIKLLQNAIMDARGRYEEGNDESGLQRILTDILSKNRFLVVMDDVWDVQAWSDVLRVPVENAGAQQPATGSRVLITTRLDNVAQQMKTPFYQHEVTPMHDENDAWRLLTRQLSPYQVQRIDDELRDIGKEIVQRCGGLPLAIKVIGGLLCKRQPFHSEWTDVLENLKKWNEASLPKELDSRLYLSYEDLSPQLKQCFLYYSLLRNDRGIPRSAIIYMWISEGFVLAQEEPEEVATRYHQELISRNLIEPSEGYRMTLFECTMHDVVRSFAQYMARDELLVVHDNNVADGSSDTSHIRRISTEPSLREVEWGVLKNQEKLRTLIIDCTINFGPSDSLTNFLSLRVLHITSKKFDGLVESLCDLKLLRSLYLENTDISRLPDGIGKLRFLQYIMLLNCKNLNNLPSSIVKLARLRALWLDGSEDSIIPKGFGKLTNLRELFGFPVLMEMGEEQPSWCSLQELGPLSELRKLRLEGLDNVPNSSLAEKAMVNSKTHLRFLQLRCNKNEQPAGSSAHEIDDEPTKQQLVEEVFDKLCAPSSIETLCMDRYFGRRLPNWLSQSRSSALPREGNDPSYRRLRHIQLVDLPCCTHLPDGLCRLPNLELLVIQGAPAIRHVGPEFLAAGGDPPFPRLKCLQLEGLCEWNDDHQDHEHATEASVAMPDLEDLDIKDCGKLTRLPTWLANRNRRSLKRMGLCNLTRLTSVEQFPSVVELHVCNSPNLERINGFSSLHGVGIVRCPGLQELGGFSKLDTIELEDTTMQALPKFLDNLNARYLHLICGRQLYESSTVPLRKPHNIDEAHISYRED